jgi:hypothetical protein
MQSQRAGAAGVAAHGAIMFKPHEFEFLLISEVTYTGMPTLAILN